MGVKSKKERLAAQDYVDQLASSGRYHFNSHEARAALKVSSDATKLALNRLSRQGLIAQPARGFYTVIPPEYRSLGCLPAEQFIPALMTLQSQTYYVGLLSAAQYYGSAHHRPQAFQVVLQKNRRPIHCGKVRVSFIARKRIGEVPVRTFNTPRGEIRVSTPEATAVDIAGYPQHAGGLDGVATVLAELADSMDANRLPQAASTAPLTWAQRLGFLMGLSEAREKSDPLRAYVQNHAREYTLLSPGHQSTRKMRVPDWKVIVNAHVEHEL
jgi:predicted transcriptional regulator of viral defense system